MAKQSNRNLKKRVSHLSRRQYKTERDLRGLAQEVGQALQQHQLQTMSSLGLTDVLVEVLEKTQPGLSNAIKEAVAARQAKVQEQAQAQATNAAAKAAEVADDKAAVPTPTT